MTDPAVDKYTQYPVSNPTIQQQAEKYVQQPLSKEEARGYFQTGAFKGNSNYDNYLVYGVDQDKLRARNQPWYDQVSNTARKLVPAIGYGILENAGYIGTIPEIFSENPDFTNALTEFATKRRQALESNYPIYRQNPEKVFDWKDSGWWIQNGESLAESIGEFFVTGAGVGGALGKGAGLLANALKAGKYGTTALSGLAQLSTASVLAYTEGAMSGAQVYKDVYNNELNLHGNKELAVKKASEAASHTVMLNTVLNTGINITSVTPLFKTLSGLRGLERLGLARGSKETLTDFLERLTKLEAAGIPQASFKKALVREAIQEGLEEDVNLYAESEGRIKGGIEKPTSIDSFQRFLDRTFSDEGALNFILGAVGGIGQTAGLDYIPYRNYTQDGESMKVSNRKLERLEEQEILKRYITSLHEDIKYLNNKQINLNAAIKNNDEVGIQQARQDLFNIAVLRAIREGTSDVFSEEMTRIAATDNSTVDEKGMTEAMRLGYANDTNDNEFRDTASKKATDIKLLADEYSNLRKRFIDKFAVDELFRRRLDIYSKEEVANNLDKKLTEFSAQLNKLATDPSLTPLLEAQSNINALGIAIDFLKEPKTKYDQAVLANLKASREVEQVVLDQAKEVDIKLGSKLNDNKGIINELALTKTPLFITQEQLKQDKRQYNELLANPKETTDTFLKLKDEISKRVEKKQKEKDIKKEKQEETEQATKAKLDKAATYTERVGNHTIKSNPKGGFDIINTNGDVIDTKTSVEEAKAIAQEENKKAPKKKIVKAQSVESAQPDKVQTPKQEEGYQGKTETVRKEEEATIAKVITAANKEDNQTRGRFNKIAYRARDTDDVAFINPDYLDLHSKDFGVGTEITLRPINDKDIGVFVGKDLKGYVHLAKEGETELQRIRDYVLTNGAVTTTIIDKSIGVLNKRTDKVKLTTEEAIPQQVAIAVGRDGKLATSVVDYHVSDKLVNNMLAIEKGITYAIVNTPNNKEIALPLDTKPITTEVVDSVMLAFQAILYPELVDSNVNKIFDEIYTKFDIDLRTPTGFEKYFKTFFYNYRLNDPIDIAEKNEDKNDKRFVEFVGNGIKFLKSGGAILRDGVYHAKELTINTPNEYKEALLEDLRNHLAKMYFNIDLEALGINTAVSVPLLYLDSNEEFKYKEYFKPSYIDHVKSVTETNVVGIPLRNGEYTYFVQPSLYFSTNFLGTAQENNYGKPPIISEEKPILARNPDQPKKKGLRSLVSTTPIVTTDTEQVSQKVVDDRKHLCEP